MRAFISFHFGLFGSASGAPLPTRRQIWPVCPTSLQWIYQRRDRLHFAAFSFLGFHFLAFWPCGPSFPCILALCAFISFHFGLFGVSFWPPPTSCQKWPVCPTCLQWVYQRRDRLHFAVFSLLGFHFLAFWPCGPSFPCGLALWAFISLHFGPVGLHFLAFWHFWGQLLGPPPHVAKNYPFAQRPYNGFISAVTGPILQFLAFWAFISLHFGLVGVHFLTFWPCRLSFPRLSAAWAFISLYIGAVVASFWAPPPQVAKGGPFSYNPYEGFISANDETHGPRWSFGPKHKRSSIIPRAPADDLPPGTNDLRSYPERPLTFCLQAQTIFDHTHSARGRFCSKHRRSSIIPMATFSLLAPARTSRAPAKASHRDFRN